MNRLYENDIPWSFYSHIWMTATLSHFTDTSAGHYRTTQNDSLVWLKYHMMIDPILGQRNLFK